MVSTYDRHTLLANSFNVQSCMQPYIVSADVARAFDNIKLEKMMDVVRSSLTYQEYSVIR